MSYSADPHAVLGVGAGGRARKEAQAGPADWLGTSVGALHWGAPNKGGGDGRTGDGAGAASAAADNIADSPSHSVPLAMGSAASAIVAALSAAGGASRLLRGQEGRACIALRRAMGEDSAHRALTSTVRDAGRNMHRIAAQWESASRSFGGMAIGVRDIAACLSAVGSVTSAKIGVDPLSPSLSPSPSGCCSV